MQLLFILLSNSLALWVVAYLVPGIIVKDFLTAVIASLVLGFFNTFLKPILTLLTLPINFLTLGLFSLVLSAAILLLTAKVVPGFEVQGFVPALVGGILLAFLASLLQTLVSRK